MDFPSSAGAGAWKARGADVASGVRRRLRGGRLLAPAPRRRQGRRAARRRAPLRGETRRANLRPERIPAMQRALQRFRARARSDLHRALWHVNRTPLAPLVKAAVVAAHPRARARRDAAGRTIAIPPPVAAIADALRAEGRATLDPVVDRARLDAACAIAADKLRRADTAEAAQLS